MNEYGIKFLTLTMRNGKIEMGNAQIGDLGCVDFRKEMDSWKRVLINLNFF